MPPEAHFDSLKVLVRGLEIAAEIGVHPHERGRPQPLIIDIELELAPEPVRHMADTINYEMLAETARGLAARGHVDLVETYAQDLAVSCLELPRALHVRVRVEKPQALAGARAAGVEVVAQRRLPSATGSAGDALD